MDLEGMHPDQPAPPPGRPGPIAADPEGSSTPAHQNARPEGGLLGASAGGPGGLPGSPSPASLAAKGLHWQCISGCGACCRLDPGERPEALEALNAEEQELYLSMVGADGWCRHYDTGGQRCRIYETRPRFCRVSNLASIFAVADGEANGFAIACCRQQIRSEHGGRGKVLKRFERALRQPPSPLA